MTMRSWTFDRLTIGFYLFSDAAIIIRAGRRTCGSDNDATNVSNERPREHIVEEGAVKAKCSEAAGGGEPSPKCGLDDGKGGTPGGQSGGPPGKPGLIKILKQAGLDNRGEVHAPLANEPDTSSGRIAKRRGGSDAEGTSPTHAYSHDHFC